MRTEVQFGMGVIGNRHLRLEEDEKRKRKTVMAKNHNLPLYSYTGLGILKRNLAE